MRLPRQGELFEQKYEIKEELGRGGFGAVFRAADVELGRDVAIKVLAPSEEGYLPGLTARFMLEARVLAGLIDSHTIRLFEFGESSDGLLYMVFQYVAGVDLATQLRRRGALPPDVAVHITTQVLQALAEAHGVGVLHRDIKPGNIMIHSYMGDEYAAKLLDFGIAKVDPAAGGIALTRTGAVVGTPRYMCPEQVFGEPLSPSSDIYSLGLVLFEMLVGRPAVEGDQREILKRHAADEVHRLPDGVVWPELQRVVERMFARSPHERYATANEAIQAFDHAMRARDATTTPSEASPAPTIDELPGGTRRAAVALVVGALVGIVGLVAVTRPTGPEPTDAPVVERQLPAALLSVRPEAIARTDDVTTPDNVRASDAGSAADLTSETGCGRPHEWQWERFVPLGHGRQARIYLSKDYDENRAHAVVLAFQPALVSNGQYVIYSGFEDLLRTNDDVIVVSVLPTDRLVLWSDPSVEIDLVGIALDEANRRYCIDRERVFAIGHHVGARMAHQLACAVPLSGLAYSGYAEHPSETLCDPRGVPVLRLAGRHDEVVPVDGGPGCADGPYLSLAEQSQLWRRRNRCSGETTRFAAPAAACDLYSCESAPFVSCVADGGHYLRKARWTVARPNCPDTLLEADFASVVWPFFETHGRRLRPDGAVTQ